MIDKDLAVGKAFDLLLAHFGIFQTAAMIKDVQFWYGKAEREHVVIFESKSTNKEICRVYVDNNGNAVLFRINLKEKA